MFSSAPNYGPNWPDLVRIRSFLGKFVRKRSELVTKSLIFTKIGIFNDSSELEYRTFILGMNALQAQGSPDVKLFVKRV